MKDKDFDQLFKDRLGEAEIEPSTDLWNSIAKDLKPRKGKTLPAYWIAAAVAIIIGSVVLLSPKEEKIRLQGKPSLASNKNLPTSETQLAKQGHLKIEHKADTDTYESTPLIIAPRLKEDYSNQQISVKRAIVVTSNPVNNQLDNIDSGDKNTNVSDDAVDIVIAKLPEAVEVNAITDAESSSKGIKNVGDFVNFVVSKVDKREDKFLKFNTDDDNSSLVGINIGFIKLNLKRNK